MNPRSRLYPAAWDFSGTTHYKKFVQTITSYRAFFTQHIKISLVLVTTSRNGIYNVPSPKHLFNGNESPMHKLITPSTHCIVSNPLLSKLSA